MSFNFFKICPPLAHLDFYKTGHASQYPDETTRIVSNLTPRMSRIEGCDYMVNFSGQVFIKEWLMGMWEQFFTPQGLKDIERYEEECRMALNMPDFDAWYLRDLHELGYLPIHIKTLPEGTKVPLRVPCLTIHNTGSVADKKKFHWLPNFLETQMSCEIWKPSCNATIASLYKAVFDKYQSITCEPDKGAIPFVEFQGHDFSMRGMSGVWDAAKSGMGHLLSFSGTDTLPAIYAAREYYGAEGFVAGSCPATEHSVMQSGGDDFKTISRLLDKYPTGILSIVCDTWDYWRVLTEVLPQLKDKIMARDGKVVIRPDSGDPFKIICGDPEAEDDTPEALGTIAILHHIFGGKWNMRGCFELDPHIGAIYGDAITLERQEAILKGLMEMQYASTNIVLGIGSFTYQMVTRDTFGVALKATFAMIEGVPVPLFKKPKTDDGTKNSAKGLVFVYLDDDDNLTLEENVSWERFMSKDNLLQDKYVDGKLVWDETWVDVKTTLRESKTPCLTSE
jgi:nicotinamide phosphoribosyltransferase